MGLRAENELPHAVSAPQIAAAVLEQSLLYAESRRPIDDKGTLSSPTRRSKMVGTSRLMLTLVVHYGNLSEGQRRASSKLRREANPSRHASSAPNHSASRLWQHAPKKIAGMLAQQEESLLEPEYPILTFNLRRAASGGAVGKTGHPAKTWKDSSAAEVQLPEVRIGRALEGPLTGTTRTVEAPAAMQRIHRGALEVRVEQRQINLGELEGDVEQIAQGLAAPPRHPAPMERAAARQEADQLALVPKTVFAIQAGAMQVSASEDKTLLAREDQAHFRLGLGEGMRQTIPEARAALSEAASTSLIKKSLNAGKIAAGEETDARGEDHRGLVQGGDKDREKEMEQLIYFRSDEEDEDVLSQVQHSLGERLVLVVPAPMDRSRLSMLLRLIRRSAAQQAQQLYLVSEDHLLRILAERMGYSVATTLDAYHGIVPGKATGTGKPARRTSMPLSSSRPATNPPGQSSPTKGQKPGAQLEAMLVDGYLPNPAATPSLEEEEERAEREEQERLRYEIADENALSQAQEEAEAHEARIIATILKTGTLSSQNVPSPAPTNPPDPPQVSDPPAHPEQDDNRGGGSREDALHQESAGRLRPMRTVDQLLAEEGQTDVFEWFARQANRQQRE